MIKLKKSVVIIFFIAIVILLICIICIQELNNKPPKLKNIKSIRVEYRSTLIESLSLSSPLEINDIEQVNQLVDCFNVKSEYGIGCSCPSDDIIIHFISDKKEYVYNIGITGDPKICYTKVEDEDIFGVDIKDIINILNKNRGSENLKYPCG